MVGAAYFFFLLLVFFLAIFFGILHTPCNDPHFSQRAVASTAKICEIDSLQRCCPSPAMLRAPPIAGVYREVSSRVCTFYQDGCMARCTQPFPEIGVPNLSGSGRAVPQEFGRCAVYEVIEERSHVR
jgi:hypothetical protein